MKSSSKKALLKKDHKSIIIGNKKVYYKKGLVTQFAKQGYDFYISLQTKEDLKKMLAWPKNLPWIWIIEKFKKFDYGHHHDYYYAEHSISVFAELLPIIKKELDNFLQQLKGNNKLHNQKFFGKCLGLSMVYHFLNDSVLPTSNEEKISKTWIKAFNYVTDRFFFFWLPKTYSEEYAARFIHVDWAEV